MSDSKHQAGAGRASPVSPPISDCLMLAGRARAYPLLTSVPATRGSTCGSWLVRCMRPARSRAARAVCWPSTRDLRSVRCVLLVGSCVSLCLYVRTSSACPSALRMCAVRACVRCLGCWARGQADGPPPPRMCRLCWDAMCCICSIGDSGQRPLGEVHSRVARWTAVMQMTRVSSETTFAPALEE